MSPTQAVRLAVSLAAAILLTSCGSASDAAPTTFTLLSQRPTTTATPKLPLEAATVPTGDLPVVRSYHIGNSLTNDSLSRRPDATGFKVLSRQAEVIAEDGWHIRCGSSLIAILENPTDTCVEPKAPFGTFQTALNEFGWDIVTVQPYPGAGSTLSTDIAFILDIIDRATDTEHDVRFYILAAWPPADGYADSWTEGVATDDPPTALSRTYFELLYERVTEQTCADVRLIPTGEVLFRLGERLPQADGITQTARTDLYRDEIHLNNYGQFVAGVTLASSLHSIPSSSLSKPDRWYGDPDGFSQAFLDLVRETAWNVITSDPRTGVGSAPPNGC